MTPYVTCAEACQRGADGDVRIEFDLVDERPPLVDLVRQIERPPLGGLFVSSCSRSHLVILAAGI